VSDIQAKARWLQELTGERPPWPIKTAHDLREWAADIDDDDLTGREMRAIDELVEELDDMTAAPEELARRRREREKLKALTFEDVVEQLLKLRG
jgi:hypothetical protein